MIAAMPPAPFPLERPDRMPTPALLTERGFSLRVLHDGDLPWLRDLYATTRAEEMASVPWPAQMKRNFLDQQFALQHAHYLQHYADTDFMAIERIRNNGDVRPVGRYYLQRVAPEHLIVDIALLPDMRGKGLGRILIEASQREAQALGRGMHLHVMQQNVAARRLYERLGFVFTHASEMYDHMQWVPVEM
jgi:ribosomal protein S18 acetylase RimI-like enzyme